MRLFLLLISFCSILISCKDDDPLAIETMLDKPPYKQLTDSIRNFPENADLYYRRGSLLHHNSQVSSAAQDLRMAWQINPSEENALAVTTALKQKSADSAISFIKQALQKLPESISLKVGLARGYQAKSALQEAINICDSIIKEYPNQLDALILKAELLKEQGKTGASLATLENAYRLAPGDKDLAYDLAYEYADEKNSNALQLTDALIKADKTNTVSRAFYIKATYFKRMGKTTEAIKYYDEALKHNYKFNDVYLDKGILFYDLKNYSAATKNFELALRIDPSTADFYYWLGKCQEATGNKEEAKNNYIRAYNLDHELTEAKEAADKLK